MKILHIGDTHLGYTHYRSEIRYNDFFDTFEELVQKAITEDVDAVIQTGDLFDSRTPSVETISRCIQIIKQLDTEDIPFYAIVGNHERKRETQWIDIIENVSVVRRLSNNETVISSNSTNESVSIYGFDAITSQEWNSKSLDIERPSQDSDYTIVCMHQLFSPPISDQSHMDTYDLNPILSEIPHSVDILALGDCHYPASESVSGTYAYYAGATERTTKSQTDVSSMMLTFSEEDYSVESVTINSARPFETCEIELAGNMTRYDIKQQLQEYDFEKPGQKNAVAIVELYGDDIGVTSSDIEQICLSQGASVVKVSDNRNSVSDIDMGELQISETDSLEAEIDNAVGALELSDTTTTIESIIRDVDGTVESNVRETVEQLVQDNTDGDQI